jgi:hypothetical protein
MRNVYHWSHSDIFLFNNLFAIHAILVDFQKRCKAILQLWPQLNYKCNRLAAGTKLAPFHWGGGGGGSGRIALRKSMMPCRKKNFRRSQVKIVDLIPPPPPPSPKKFRSVYHFRGQNFFPDIQKKRPKKFFRTKTVQLKVKQNFSDKNQLN